MRAFYNEIDRYCCDWLQNLMDAGLITPGKIDDRSIADLTPDDVRGYGRCHFFAGIAGWELALSLSEYDGPVCWTGSCPCQPFSAAGKGQASGDERHLWPVWFELIKAVRPPVIFGEQVEAAIGWGWLDLVHTDMEQEGYTIRSTVLPAASVGAPHIRQRLWFTASQVADTKHRVAAKQDAQGTQRRRATEFVLGSKSGELADTGSDGVRRGQEHRQDIGASSQVSGEIREQRFRPDDRADSSNGELADANGGHASTEGLQRSREQRQQSQDGGSQPLALSSSNGWGEGGGQRDDQHTAQSGGWQGKPSGGVAEPSIMANPQRPREGRGAVSRPAEGYRAGQGWPPDRSAGCGSSGRDADIMGHAAVQGCRGLEDEQGEAGSREGRGHAVRSSGVDESELADTNTVGSIRGERTGREAERGVEQSSSCGLAYPQCDGGRPDLTRREAQGREAHGWSDQWSDLIWLPCTDGKQRPTQPGIFPLAHGLSARVGRLRAAGNAIVPQVASAFIRATMT